LDETLSQALAAGLSTDAEYLSLWLCRIGFLTVGGCTSADVQRREQLQTLLERASAWMSRFVCSCNVHAYSHTMGAGSHRGGGSDPTHRLVRLQIALVDGAEAQTRPLWEQMARTEFGQQWFFWTEYLSHAKRFNWTTDTIRDLHRRAAKYTQDNLLAAVAAWEDFEILQGDWAQLTKCRKTCTEAAAKAYEQYAAAMAASAAGAGTSHGASQDGGDDRKRGKQLGKDRDTSRQTSRKRPAEDGAGGNVQHDDDETSAKASSRSKRVAQHSGRVAMRTLLVSGLPAHLTQADIVELMSAYGDVEGISVEPMESDADEEPAQKAIVIFSSEEACQSAASLDGSVLAGQRRLCVMIAAPTAAGDDGDRRAESAASERNAARKEAFADAQAQSEAEGAERTVVFVSNVPSTFGRQDLVKVFGGMGRMADVRMLTNKKGKFKGAAYIEFEKPESAIKAVALRNKQVVDGHLLKVVISNPKLVRRAAEDASEIAKGGVEEADDKSGAKSVRGEDSKDAEQSSRESTSSDRKSRSAAALRAETRGGEGEAESGARSAPRARLVMLPRAVAGRK
jgi:RNA recognition motif-containing protein